MKIKLGMKVKWNCDHESKYDNCEWLKKGMIGIVKEDHPEIMGTGIVINDDGDIDEGIREWWVIDFGKSGTRAIDTADFGKDVIIMKGEQS